MCQNHSGQQNQNISSHLNYALTGTFQIGLQVSMPIQNQTRLLVHAIVAQQAVYFSAYIVNINCWLQNLHSYLDGEKQSEKKKKLGKFQYFPRNGICYLH